MGKFYDAIIGLVVGDALGVPFEFHKRDTFKAVDMVGYGTYDQPPGTWSDDSSLTLATVESIVRMGKIDPDDIMHNFYQWLFFGEFTPFGKVFDVGNTTRMAIQRYRYEGEKPINCGGSSLMDNGNGSLMRILPLAFTSHSYQDIENVSSLTHSHHISKNVCNLYDDIARYLLKGNDKNTAVRKATFLTCQYYTEFQRIWRIADYPREEIKSTGYVVDSLEAALWCFLNSDSYKECVLKAVNLGDDTDTIAAIAGGLAGIYYGIGGEKGIPEEWIEQIKRLDYIKDLCESFENKILK